MSSENEKVNDAAVGIEDSARAESRPTGQTTEILYQQGESIFGLHGRALVARGWSVFPQEVDGRRPGRVFQQTIKWAEDHHLRDCLPAPDVLDLWCGHCATLNVACVFGPASGNAFAVDIDCMDEVRSNAIMELAEEHLGPTTFMREGRAPKLALLYRTTPGDMPPSFSRNFEARDGFGRPEKSGDGLEILSSGKLITIYGRHHKTGRYFQWMSPTAQPLTAGPEALPLVTSEQVATFLEAVADKFPFWHGTSAPAAWVQGDASVHGVRGARMRGGSYPRNEDGLVFEGRDGFMRDLVLRIVADASNWPGEPKEHGADAGLFAAFCEAVESSFREGAVIDGRWARERDLKATIAEKVSRTMRNVASGHLRTYFAGPALPAAVPGQALPAQMSAAEASAALTALVREHVAAAAAWVAAKRVGEPPALAIKGMASLGKTVAILQALATPECEGLRVLYAAPTLKLAEDVAKAARQLGIDVRVLRGRSQPRPDDPDSKMCAKADIAEMLAQLSAPVKTTLCRQPCKKGDEPKECLFAATCPYLAQIEALKDRKSGPTLWVCAHQYLSTPLEGLTEKAFDLLVVDESFWRALTRTVSVDPAAFLTVREPGEKLHARKGEDRGDFELRRNGMTVRHAGLLDKVRAILLDNPRKTISLADFRAAGLDAEECEWAAGFEYTRLGSPDITPDMDEAEQLAIVSRARREEAFGFARFWRVLGAELALERDQLVGIERVHGRWNEETEQLENGILLHYSADPRLTELPVILIDADLDPEIACRFYPRVQGNIHVIAAAWSPRCRVRQVGERPVSKSMLLGRPGSKSETDRAEARREDLWNMMLDMADRHGHPSDMSGATAKARARRPLLITFLGVRQAWAKRGRLGTPELPLATPDSLPFDVAHFNANRGLDGWKETTGIVVAGRLQPSVGAIESLARGIFFRDPRPLALLPFARDGRGDRTDEKDWPTTIRYIQLRDGRRVPVSVPAHTDPRCDAVLLQVRDAEITQSLARCRPIHRAEDAPCEIVLATSVPVDGLIVDELVTWNDLVPSKLRMMEVEGRVIPENATDMAAAYPDLWKSPDAVRVARATAREKSLTASTAEESLLTINVSESPIIYRTDWLTFIANKFGEVNRIARWVEVTYDRVTPGGTRHRRSRAAVRVRSGDTCADVLGRASKALPFASRLSLADGAADVIALAATPAPAASEPPAAAPLPAAQEDPQAAGSEIRLPEGVPAPAAPQAPASAPRKGIRRAGRPGAGSATAGAPAASTVQDRHRVSVLDLIRSAASPEDADASTSAAPVIVSAAPMPMAAGHLEAVVAPTAAPPAVVLAGFPAVAGDQEDGDDEEGLDWSPDAEPLLADRLEWCRATLQALAVEAWGDLSYAHAWLYSAHPDFGWQAPLDACVSVRALERCRAALERETAATVH
ncbi:bifunctional DNA primase/polymerase [Rhodovastum atsumiense]|uniref:DNA primase/polymerase bifunctional N-terminal domain-containing protein n=1 Tax=Rhodovastum atsumiense TaxID=504468 RepID=A0A5M6IU41_9PROT|nr:bifunctional DNA primase/polymerase [Rhodovastum atsumiense]KAA5611836.1 hypothetical protein F1189_12425 [Rhodovastum atsumiense]